MVKVIMKELHTKFLLVFYLIDFLQSILIENYK